MSGFEILIQSKVMQFFYLFYIDYSFLVFEILMFVIISNLMFTVL